MAVVTVSCKDEMPKPTQNEIVANEHLEIPVTTVTLKKTNSLNESYLANDQNQIISFTSDGNVYKLAYDEKGNLTECNYFDKKNSSEIPTSSVKYTTVKGQFISDGTKYFEFNSQKQIAIFKVLGSNKEAKYSYDKNGNLAKVNIFENGSIKEVVKFSYENVNDAVYKAATKNPFLFSIKFL